MKNSVLITGGTGFIGSHLVPLLIRQGWPIKLAVRSLINKLNYEVESVVVGDIDGTTNWTTALQGVQIVIHLAARAHVLYENTRSSESLFFKVNYEGTKNLVQQSIDAGVEHFIFLSSVGAMANSSDVPLTETFTCKPNTPYGQSKLQAEESLISLAKQTSMAWTILRPTLVYGTGNPGNMESLIKGVKLGLPLPLKMVKNYRNLLYVGNLVDVIAICLIHPQAKNKVFLVSDGQKISTPELVCKIAYHLKRACHLVSLHTSILKLAGYIGDIIEYLLNRRIIINTRTIERLLSSLIVDTSYIQNTLNWQPPYTIDEGLSQTLRSQWKE